MATEAEFVSLMKHQDKIRNIAIAAHIDHGKTTFSDNLLAGAGMLSQETAGKQRALDFHEDEAERGITIDSASVSMIHEVNGEDHLINLIDTPGHVDFGGDVTRAMRAVDGCVILSCAVEGVMPQTETVVRQALKELVKPVLFINKVDRLIKEVKLTPEEMQAKFIKIIDHVNILIEQIAPEGYKEKWKVGVSEGTVAFGSAFHNWALSFPYMKEKNITFKEVIDAYTGSDDEISKNIKELAKKAPLHEIVLGMSVSHHPNPVDAQKYRIPKIWKGDIESEEGKDLVDCNDKGTPVFVPIKITVDKHAGEIAAGRMFSGTIKQGDELYMSNAKSKVRVQQVSVYKGAQRVVLDEVSAGNIVGIVGLRDVVAGETVAKNEIVPFEAITHLFDPVVTKSIEATKAADLPKLIEVLRQVGKEDPSIKVQINEQTGESLLSGMGELHLEIIENRIKTEKGLEVRTSAPIIVYRETVTKESPVAEGRSPNKHNSFFIKVAPLEDEVYNLIRSGDLPEGRVKKKSEAVTKVLSETLGWGSDEIRNVKDIYKGSMFLDETRGEVNIGEVIEMVMDAFEMVMDEGPLAREPTMKMKVSLVDIKLHEDAIHRGPAQVYPAVRDAVKGAMQGAGSAIFEPLQVHVIEAPDNFMGTITKLVGGKRGQMLDMKQEDSTSQIKSKIPVAEMIGWSNDLRSATEGRGTSSIVEQDFERVPQSMQDDIIKKIRERKGLSENQ
jgi:elongation factor 2